MTYERTKLKWSSGFRGYKDMSPEAIDRRHMRYAAQEAYIKIQGLISFTNGVLITEVGSDVYNALKSHRMCKPK